MSANRRTFLRRGCVGVGSAALATLLNPELLRATSPACASASAAPAPSRSTGAIEPLHLPARAKRVIFLYMAGGPSHLETFDPKPKLTELNNQLMPESFTQNQPIAQLQGQKLTCMGPIIGFQRHGKSGQTISDYLPHHARIADDIAIIRSMHTDQINHDPAHTVMNTGSSVPGRPSIGSWVLYGLGSETQNLPGFIVLTSFAGRSPQPISTRMWNHGFLPGKFQGVAFNPTGDAVHYLSSPAGVSAGRQRDVVDAVRELDAVRAAEAREMDLASAASATSGGGGDIATRIANYEMAFRLQTSVPELMDLRDEPPHILDLYGIKPEERGQNSFAANCLLARRLAERGVRFIQLYHRDWDHHNDLDRYMRICCRATDQAAAALVLDLKQRGMLDDTLVIWGGEFGRTPMVQGNKGGPGRDHHMKAFSMWLAGGGIKGGTTYGQTDDLGYNAAIDPVHVNDLHATVLHLLGIDHARLTHRHQGRDFRLTDVAGRVVRGLLA